MMVQTLVNGEICFTLPSIYAGCAFTKSYVGYVHAIAHSLGGEYNIPHGLANAMILMQMPHICLSKKIKQMNWKHSILR